MTISKRSQSVVYFEVRFGSKISLTYISYLIVIHPVLKYQLRLITAIFSDDMFYCPKRATCFGWSIKPWSGTDTTMKMFSYFYPRTWRWFYEKAETCSLFWTIRDIVWKYDCGCASICLLISLNFYLLNTLGLLFFLSKLNIPRHTKQRVYLEGLVTLGLFVMLQFPVVTPTYEI